MHLFTYGTLMFSDVWRTVVGRAHPSLAAWCHNFACYTVRGEEYPAMVAAPGEVVEGRVYFDLDSTAIATIDCFETGMYSREVVEVVCAGGETLACHAYLLCADFYNLLSAERWSRANYLRGGHHQKFAARYLAKLQSHPS